MKLKLPLLALALSLSIASCKKTTKETGAADKLTGINSLVVPKGFTWESARNVNLTVNITDDRFQNALHVIAVYDGDPLNGGALLAKGSASKLAAFTSKLYLPGIVQEVFVVKTSPDNSTIVQKVKVTASDISLSVGAIDPNVAAVKSNGIKINGESQGLSAGPDCNSGCSITVTSSNNNLNINNGDVVCVTGSNITIGVNANGGTLRICGSNVTVQNANFNNSATIIVTSSGSATFGNLNLNSSTSSFQNYGVAIVTGMSLGGVFQNDGTLSTSNGDLNMNSGSSTFTNNGTITVNGSMNINTLNVSTNNGSITTNRDFTLNSTARFINNCSIYAKNNYNNNSLMRNNNLIKADNATTINSNTTLELNNGAMLKTKDIQINGTINGLGATSLVKVTNSTLNFNSGAKIQNAVQYCSANGMGQNNNGQFSGGAAQGCSLYIPVTTCNGEGNGTPVVTDTDGDGVPDTLDDYPTDPLKAYNNNVPTGAIAFEDLWPSKGDFDLNDLVVSYKYTIVTNAQNKVVKVKGDYVLFATGGNLGNGFGVEFPIASANMQNLAGATKESGQTKAVAIIFDNMRNEMAHWNTVPGETQSATKSYSISFDVANGPLLSTFGMDAYNPFIWNFGLGANRGREIHLSGKTPTDLADRALFGTKDDDTNVAAGRYYVTKTGLPYAISIPVAPFNYPVEQTDITQAFLHFADWAQSGGSQYPDWYSNLGAGYRNTAKIYVR